MDQLLPLLVVRMYSCVTTLVPRFYFARATGPADNATRYSHLLCVYVHTSLLYAVHTLE